MVNITNFSTQADEPEGILYRLRNEEDIYNMISFIRFGSADRGRPLYFNYRGFIYAKTPNELAQEMLYYQKMYRKTAGVRIRGEFVVITKDELTDPSPRQQICMIADRFSDYFFYNGFQCVYSIFDRNSFYEIIYGINSTSYADGHKYHHNSTDVRDMQLNILNSILSEITGKVLEQPFNFQRLEQA